MISTLSECTVELIMLPVILLTGLCVVLQHVNACVLCCSMSMPVCCAAAYLLDEGVR